MQRRPVLPASWLEVTPPLMARLRFNVPSYRPAANAPLSEVPDAPEDSSCGWYESSRDLQDGVMISEWGSLEDVEELRTGA